MVDACFLLCIYMPAIDRPLSDCRYSDLPEMLPVDLKAGQTIFWEGGKCNRNRHHSLISGNISNRLRVLGDLIHRGRMHPGNKFQYKYHLVLEF